MDLTEGLVQKRHVLSAQFWEVQTHPSPKLQPISASSPLAQFSSTSRSSQIHLRPLRGRVVAGPLRVQRALQNHAPCSREAVPSISNDTPLQICLSHDCNFASRNTINHGTPRHHRSAIRTLTPSMTRHPRPNLPSAPLKLKYMLRASSETNRNFVSPHCGSVARSQAALYASPHWSFGPAGRLRIVPAVSPLATAQNSTCHWIGCAIVCREQPSPLALTMHRQPMWLERLR